MAGKRFSKGSEEFMMFMDYWALCQKFWIPEESDEYWEDVIAETDAFYNKYEKTVFSKGLVLALVDSLDDKLRG